MRDEQQRRTNGHTRGGQPTSGASETDLFARRVDQLGRQIASMRRHATRLHEHARPVLDDAAPEPAEVFDDLLTALESLGVAEDELRQQHEELGAAYAALDAERTRYRDLFDGAPVAYVVTDADGAVRDANVAAGRLVGVPARELIRKPLVAYVAAEDRRRFRDTLTLLAAGDGAAETTVTITPRGGSEIAVAVSGAAPYYAAPRGQRYVRWVLRDVTAERAAQRTAERINEELEARVAERTRELRLRTAEVESANRAKTAFLTTMSHEFRTPLNAVVGYADLLDAEIPGPLTPAQRAYVDRLRASGRHLTGLVEDVLDVAKIEAGQMTLRIVRRSLHSAVDAALSLVRPQASVRHVAVRHECETDPGCAYAGDETRVRQILANLLANAVKFTPPDGRVTVRCGTSDEAPPGTGLSGEGPWAWVTVTDTGIGIPAEQLAAIFEPFVQGEQGYSRSHGGTGLGLTISRLLARLMGGDVTAESEVARGAVFTLWLPVAAADGATP
jgi:PAS domain S-box-containing protein